MSDMSEMLWAAINSQGRIIYVETYRRDVIKKCLALTGMTKWKQVKREYGIKAVKCIVTRADLPDAKDSRIKELEAQLAAMIAERDDYKAAYDDTKRLARVSDGRYLGNILGGFCSDGSTKKWL